MVQSGFRQQRPLPETCLEYTKVVQGLGLEVQGSVSEAAGSLIFTPLGGLFGEVLPKHWNNTERVIRRRRHHNMPSDLSLYASAEPLQAQDLRLNIIGLNIEVSRTLSSRYPL